RGGRCHGPRKATRLGRNPNAIFVARRDHRILRRRNRRRRIPATKAGSRADLSDRGERMSYAAVALSDLSVTEFLTLSRMGFLPRGLVIGSAVWDSGAPAMFAAFSQSARDSNAQSVAESLRSARQ